MEIIEHGKTYKTSTCTYRKCAFVACKKKTFIGVSIWSADA